jgi:biopolymer transport protein ExbD
MTCSQGFDEIRSMGFRRRQTSHSMPEINLVPMLDVLMTVLTFFIVISMVMAVEKGVNVQLPTKQTSPSTGQNEPDPFVAQMTVKELKVNDKVLKRPELLAQIKRYLAKNPKGVVALQIAPEVSYEKAVELLGEMKEVGGDRVSLAIE